MSAPAAAPELKAPVLVLGATGKVGAPTVHALVAAHHTNIRVLVRNEAKARKELALPPTAHVTFITGDLEDLTSVANALKGVERVFNISPTGDVKNIAAVAKLAKEAHVKLFLHLSVLGADPACPKNTFQYNHAKGEDAVAELELPFVFLRPTFFFQNWLGEAGAIKYQGAFYRPPLDGPSTAIDTRDIADAAATVLTASDLSKHLGRTYLLSGGAEANVGYDALAKLISGAIGKEVKAVVVDDASWYGALQQNGVPEYLAWLLLKLYHQARLGLTVKVFGDYKILTGKEPRKLADFFAENKAQFV